MLKVLFPGSYQIRDCFREHKGDELKKQMAKDFSLFVVFISS